MRVLHLVNWMNNAGNGITNVAVDLAWAQVEAGYEVHVATKAGSYLPMMRARGIGVHHLDLTVRGPIPLAQQMRRLSLLVRDIRPDVVHSHVIAGTVLARTASRRPVVATVHNEYQRGASLMGFFAHRVVGVSDAVTEAMESRHVPRRKLTTVHNGVVGSPRRIASSEHVSEDIAPGPTVMTLGAVSERKGSDVLVEAFARVLQHVPDAHLYFVGNQDWPELGERVSAGELRERIHFAGYRDHPETMLQHADVFVLPSRKDPYPLALLEAMERGLPIVASRVDGIPEALGFGEYGLLTEPGDSSAVADAVVDLLLKKDRARGYAEKARERARDFTIEKMAEGYQGVYEEVLR